MKCSITSLYLCVTDMERALKFYTHFFELEPIIKDDIYSVYDINGFRLGLFAFQKMKEQHTWGSNCLPSIEVESLQVLKDKIKELEVCFPLKAIGTNWVAEFVDSEGNHIEITTPVIS